MSEQAQRELLFDRLETWHARRLRVIREAMAALYRTRVIDWGDSACVSGNDVRRWLLRNPEWDAGGSANWRAAVFTSKEWEWTGGMVESTAPGGHRTKIQTYRLREGR